MRFGETESLTPKKSTKHWWYIGLTVFLVLAACYYISGRAVGTVEPWVWNRGDDVPVAKQKGGITAWLGFTTSVVGTSASSGYSHKECVDLSRIAVLSSNDHPLSLACAEKIAEKLKTIRAIQQIEFAPHGTLIGKDKPLPPWVVRVDASNAKEWTMPTRSLSGNIFVSFGTIAATSNVFGDYIDTPLVSFEHSATHNASFRHIGIGTQSLFYDNIAEEIAKKTVEAMAAEFDKLSRIASPLPQLPVAFYPAYREASELPPLPNLVSTTTIFDGRRLMLPHHSLLRIELNSSETDNEILTGIRETMQEDGWEGRVHDRGNSAYLRLTRDNETFYMFKEQRSDFVAEISLAIQGQITGNVPPPPPPPKSHVFLLERAENIDRSSEYAAIQTLLDENAPPSTLLPFTRRVMFMNNDDAARSLREQMRERLLEVKANTPAEQLALAKFFEQAGDTDTAKEMLFKAWRIRQLTPYPTSDDNYTSLAQRLKIDVEELEALPPPTAELCEEFGFVLLLPEDYPHVVQIEWNKEARFATINEDGLLSLLLLTERYENGKFLTDNFQKTFRQHGSSESRTQLIDSQFGSLRAGDKGGTFYLSRIVGIPFGSGDLRVRIEFRQ